MAQPDSSHDADTAAAPPRTRGGGLSGPVILIGVTVVLALIAIFYWPEKQTPPAPARPAKPADRVTVLEQRVAADEARLAVMEKSARDWSGLAARVDALEQKQEAAAVSPSTAAPVVPAATPPDLAARLDSFALKSDEGALAARIAKLENQDAGRALNSAAAALAFANLSRATDGNENFARELHTLAPLMPDAPEAQDLARYAKGVPTRTALAAGFKDAADRALATGRRARAKTWLGRLWVNLSALVSIRRVDAEAGTDPESRFARAGADLRAGNLDAAVDELRGLDGPERDAISGWMKDAEARIAVDRDMRALTDRLAARLAQHPGAP